MKKRLLVLMVLLIFAVIFLIFSFIGDTIQGNVIFSSLKGSAISQYLKSIFSDSQFSDCNGLKVGVCNICVCTSNCGYGYGYGCNPSSGYGISGYGGSGYGYGYGYGYGTVGYGSSGYSSGYGYGISGYGYGITGAVITGMAVSESCYVEPKPRGSVVNLEKVGDSSECKMCDGYGGVMADISKDGKPCKYITGWVTKTVNDGICRNGECVPPDECYASGNFKKDPPVKFTVKGDPFNAENNKIYLEKLDEMRFDSLYKDFKDCKYPADWKLKCPADKCNTIFSEEDVKVTTEPKNIGEEKECSGMKISSFEASSGNCYGEEAAKKQLLADVNAKMNDKLAEFRADPEIKKTCPSECNVKTDSRMSNIQKYKLYAVNWVTATVSYKIYCAGKYKTSIQENEITIYFSRTKYCVKN